MSTTDNTTPNYKIFFEYPSALEEANKTYKQITSNYHNRALHPKVNQPSDEDYGICVCEYQPGDPIDDACGSECINRVLFIECTGDCPIGDYCKNKRFQQAEYSVVDVFKTESKGYGLRAMEPIKKNTFIIEYTGEIVPKDVFYQRQTDYAKKGIEHFYFMSLTNGELIDATKKGCIARFMNHSCNPNCFIQKWIVNKRTRIGIFALRDIVLGEELTFDYNTDRKGMAAQKCHCNEDNCCGYLGGQKGSDDESDDEGEGEMGPIQDPEDVPEFIRTMIRTLHNRDEVLDILYRLEMTDDNDVFSKFKHLHGLLVLKAYLVEWRHDDEIVLKTLEVLPKLPILARNTITDAKIEEKMEIFKERSPQMKDLVDAKSGDLLLSYTDVQKRLSYSHYIPYHDNRNHHTYNNEPERRPRYESSRDFYESYSSYKPSSVNDSYRSSHNNDQRTSTFTSTDRYRPTPQLVARHQQRSPNKGESSDTAVATNNVHHNKATTSSSSVLQATPPQPPQSTLALPDPTSLPQVPRIIQPGSLHPNWREVVGDEGQVYYYNVVTNKTQWERPVVEDRQTLEGYSVASINAVIERVMASQHVAVEPEPQGEEEGAKVEPAAAMSETAFKEELQKLVIDRCSRWKGEFKVADFKKHARRLAHLVVDKEFRRQKEGVYVVTDSLRSRIKKFVADYIGKLLAHRGEPLETSAGQKRSLEDRSEEGGHHKKSKN
ncbi:9888_t:CDS:10 [Ambispora gerdemannii]|uniref:[histone H3]-lysine(36) N-trimethyltransferase n=1 Tax=Ambispora gerdemannii TaxID=144530 RepID=A0A9N8WRN3_9GLOM|nr:9888_t:CDS:10 [Ambispora gerdemannii]